MTSLGVIREWRARGYRAPVRRFPLILVLMMAAAACGGGGGGAEEDDATATTAAAPAPTTTAAVATTTPNTTLPQTAVTLRITDVRLLNSEESDNSMRILLPQGVSTASVTVTGLPSPNRVISVCQARELDRRLSGAACRQPQNGEAVNVTLGTAATGIEIVQVGVSSGGPAGNATALEEVSIRYSASSREVSARLTQIASGEAGGRPTFAMTPPSSDGAYRAALTWTVIQVFGGTPSNAQLELVQGGTVRDNAQSGALEVRLNGTVQSPGGEFAIRVQNAGSSALVTPKLTLVLP